MNSWKTVKLLGSAALPRAIHWHGLFTAGAVLTCVAVALNAGPFAKIPKPSLSAENAAGEVARITMQPNVSHPISPPDFEPPTLLADSQSAIQVADTLESIHPIKEYTPESSSLAAVELASSASQFDAAEQRSADLQGQSPRDESGLIDSATHHQTGDADSDLLKSATIVGVWSPNVGTCSARDFREGALPAVISTDGAWAGETFCMFSNKKVTDTGWSVVAKCSNPRERWTTNVRLTVKDNRLTWTSRRGTQAYSRCAPDVLMAEAR